MLENIISSLAISSCLRGDFSTPKESGGGGVVEIVRKEFGSEQLPPYMSLLTEDLMLVVNPNNIFLCMMEQSAISSGTDIVPQLFCVFSEGESSSCMTYESRGIPVKEENADGTDTNFPDSYVAKWWDCRRIVPGTAQVKAVSDARNTASEKQQVGVAREKAKVSRRGNTAMYRY